MPVSAKISSKSSAAPVSAFPSLPVDPANILTLPELAARLKVSERWCYEKTRSRCLTPLPCIRVGRYLRFDWLDVSAWLRQQRTFAANKRAA
jgi:predicted DNA-binding transcriptional regulator AlpA